MYTVSEAIEDFQKNKFTKEHDRDGYRQFQYYISEYSVGTLTIQAGLDRGAYNRQDSYFETFTFHAAHNGNNAARPVFKFQIRPEGSYSVVVLYHDLRMFCNDGEFMNRVICRALNRVGQAALAISPYGRHHYIYNNYKYPQVIDVSTSVLRCKPYVSAEAVRMAYNPELEQDVEDSSFDELYTPSVVNKLIRLGIFSHKLLTINNNSGFNTYVANFITDETTIAVAKNTRFDTAAKGKDLLEEFAQRVYKSRYVQLPPSIQNLTERYIWEHIDSFPLLYLNLHRNAILKAVRGGEYYMLVGARAVKEIIFNNTADMFDAGMFEHTDTKHHTVVHLEDCIEL